ncbi:hypothetical protein [uncultured Phascolarctobacterium sp.]|uniref:hypothetical protein n=1 Tax=uncultured Phascolarctobacterium sp. TaxID=512296 RepID=UPI0025ECEA08|nr:hypothetical protein [uncultured Phascolarctobacterium sp.]
MKQQAFQPGELRDEHDNIIRAGAYGKKTPFVNSDNSAILDYIMNNFDALYAQIPNGRAYVKSVNNITPDSNGNVTVNVGSGGGSGTNITVDSALSSTSTNPVQNKVLYAALNNKLDKNGTATYAARDSSGNIISSTYAKKTDLSSYVKSINNVKPDSAGNVNISSSGGGSNITVDSTLSGTSSNAIANKAVYAALDNKLDKTGTAAAATKATQDSYGNVIVNTYARKSDLSGYVKTINNMEPDANGNINISTVGGGTGTSITVDTTLSSTSNNPIANKAVYTAVNNKLDKTGIAAYATRDSSGNIITDTYAKKSEVSGVVKSVNNIAPDSNGNVTITVSGGTGGNITIDSALSSTSTNAIQNRVVQQEFTSVRAAIPTKVSQLTNDSGYLTQHQSLDGYVKTSGQNVWRAQQTFNLATLGYEQYTTPNSSTSSVSPSTSAASYYATGAFTLNLATLSALLGSNQSTVFTAYITAGGDYALSITNGGTVKYIGAVSDLAITSAGLLLNILMTKDSYGSLTSIVQANKLT